GRKRLFLVTLGWYATFTVLTAFSWNFASFAIFRLLCGMGIGGEYAAINSTIDELIPSRHRGWVDLAVNGSWWFGTMLGSGASIVLLNPAAVDQRLGWRLAFGLGAILALVVLALRRALPESPRWLLIRGRLAEAEAIVRNIETRVPAVDVPIGTPQENARIAFVERQATTFADVARTMLLTYPRRTVLALSLMVSQAFLYNAIFFTEALVLSTFFGVDASNVGYYIFPFALGNLLGPILLGRAFDTIGRRAMIATTYLVSGVLLGFVAVLFAHHLLDATTVTLAWSVVFFFASAGASSAYLTVSEIFPLEIRASAIALVYAIGTLVGGAGAPYLFGLLVASKSAEAVALGYAVGAVAMVAGGVVALLLGVDAERKMLEAIAPPLAALSAHPEV
ncbi:MAG: MFS transporter, partial [Candidatus Baltobacteraceae bacterium]